MRPDQATRRSESSPRSQPLMWFQLAKMSFSAQGELLSAAVGVSENGLASAEYGLNQTDPLPNPITLDRYCTHT